MSFTAGGGGGGASIGGSSKYGCSTYFVILSVFKTRSQSAPTLSSSKTLSSKGTSAYVFPSFKNGLSHHSTSSTGRSCTIASPISILTSPATAASNASVCAARFFSRSSRARIFIASTSPNLFTRRAKSACFSYVPLATNCSFRKIEKEESVSVKFIIIREKKKSFFSSLLGFEANKKMKYAPDGKEAALTDSKRVSSCPARCSMSQG